MPFQKLLHSSIFHLRILGIIKITAIFSQIRFSVRAPECKSSTTVVSFWKIIGGDQGYNVELLTVRPIGMYLRHMYSPSLRASVRVQVEIHETLDEVEWNRRFERVIEVREGIFDPLGLLFPLVSLLSQRKIPSTVEVENEKLTSKNPHSIVI